MKQRTSKKTQYTIDTNKEALVQQVWAIIASESSSNNPTKKKKKRTKHKTPRKPRETDTTTSSSSTRKKKESRENHNNNSNNNNINNIVSPVVVAPVINGTHADAEVNGFHFKKPQPIILPSSPSHPQNHHHHQIHHHHFPQEEFPVLPAYHHIHHPEPQTMITSMIKPPDPNKFLENSHANANYDSDLTTPFKKPPKKFIPSIITKEMTMKLENLISAENVKTNRIDHHWTQPQIISEPLPNIKRFPADILSPEVPSPHCSYSLQNSVSVNRIHSLNANSSSDSVENLVDQFKKPPSQIVLNPIIGNESLSSSDIMEYCVTPQDYRILENQLIHNTFENVSPDYPFKSFPDTKGQQEEAKTRKRTAEGDLVNDTEEIKKRRRMQKPDQKKKRVSLRITSSKMKKDLHTRIGPNFQADLSTALVRDISDEDRVGQLSWDPYSLTFSEVETEVPFPRFVETEMKSEDLRLPTAWSLQEYNLFLEGMRTDPKNFLEISKKIGPSKTLREVIQFYWFWRGTIEFKKFKRREVLERAQENGLRPVIHIKDVQSERNPRFRNTPRVDYSYSTFMSKFKEQGPYATKTEDSASDKENSSDSKRCRKKKNRKTTKKDDDEYIEPLIPYEVSVYADIYFPEDELAYLSPEKRKS